MGELSLKEALLNTEIERMAEVFDEDPEHNSSYPNYVSDNDGEYDFLEESEGVDGQPLSEDEEWARTINGFSDNGFDRPLQLRQDRGYEDAIAERDAAIASLRQQNAELAHRADPQARARAQQAREQALYEMISNPEAAAGLIGDLTRQNQDMAASRANASLNAAHRAHGREFERAYTNLTSMDPNHPAARALVQSIWDAQDPGAALMEWHQMTGGRPVPQAVGGGASRGRMPPSLNSGERAYRSDRASGRPQRGSSNEWPVGEEMDVGPYNSSEDAEVMASVWR